MPDSEGRVCTKCEQWQTWDNFYTAERGINGKTARCKFCIGKYEALRYASNSAARIQQNRAYRLAKQYTMDQYDYWDMLEAQQDKCAVCFFSFDGDKDTHIDHDHVTGKVRGILCARCNMMIGLSRESQATLISAANYLKEHSNV